METETQPSSPPLDTHTTSNDTNDKTDAAGSESIDSSKAASKKPNGPPEPVADTEAYSIPEFESQEWLKGIGTAADSKDAFKRGAYCLRAQALPAAIYWLNQALKDARIPRPPPIPEREVDPSDMVPEQGEDQKAEVEPIAEEKKLTPESEQDDADNSRRRTRSASRSRSRSPMKAEPVAVSSDQAPAEAAPDAMELDEEHFEPDADLAKVLVFRARALQLSGDHITAIGDFASSLKLTPVGKLQIGALVLRAKSYAALNRMDLALKDYETAQNLDPNELSVYLGRSAMYVDQRQYDLALNDCQRVLELDPKHVIANRRAGLIFADTQRIPQAIRAFNRALAVRADYECLTLRGRSYVQIGEFDSALADYSMAVSIAPNVPLAYGHRSVLYAHLKRLDLAVNDATAFIRLSSGEQCISAFQNRGVWWAQMGEYDKAIEDFTFVIDQQPTNSFAYMSRGTAYSQLKRYEQSIQDWLKVSEMNPEMVKAYYNLGKQYFYNKDYEHADKYYQEVVRLAPENPAGYCERARTLCEQSKWPEALQCWTESLQHDRQNPELYVGRAQTYLQLGDVEAAVRDYTDCIQLNPADPTPYERRAACFLRLKQVDAGRQDLITAKKLRWTIDFEKISYQNALNAKNQAAPSHMAVVRAAKAAAAASVSNSIPLPPARVVHPLNEEQKQPGPESKPETIQDRSSPPNSDLNLTTNERGHLDVVQDQDSSVADQNENNIESRPKPDRSTDLARAEGEFSATDQANDVDRAAQHSSDNAFVSETRPDVEMV